MGVVQKRAGLERGREAPFGVGVGLHESCAMKAFITLFAKVLCKGLSKENELTSHVYLLAVLYRIAGKHGRRKSKSLQKQSWAACWSCCILCVQLSATSHCFGNIWCMRGSFAEVHGWPTGPAAARLSSCCGSVPCVVLVYRML